VQEPRAADRAPLQGDRGVPGGAEQQPAVELEHAGVFDGRACERDGGGGHGSGLEVDAGGAGRAGAHAARARDVAEPRQGDQAGVPMQVQFAQIGDDEDAMEALRELNEGLADPGEQNSESRACACICVDHRRGREAGTEISYISISIIPCTSGTTQVQKTQ